MNTDRFAHKAGSYEKNPKRVDNVVRIAETMLATLRLDPAMHIMDFGSGTGLLLEQIAPHVAHITAVDVSPSMNEQLRAKLDQLPCGVDIVETDLTAHGLEQRFDGIISSMTLHHIQDIDAMLRRFHDHLVEGGFIALADLDQEDGSFHEEDTGVFHAGFEREALAAQARAAGFHEVRMSDASVVNKPQGDYPVFLLTAYR